ncbi:dihydrofolate reductase, partial [Burkholderia multivorans]
GRRLDWELVDIDEANPRSFGRPYRPKGRAAYR